MSNRSGARVQYDVPGQFFRIARVMEKSGAGRTEGTDRGGIGHQPSRLDGELKGSG